MEPNTVELHNHILSAASIRVLVLSVQSFRSAVSSRYVRDKLKRYIKPVLAVSVGVFFIGFLLTFPLRFLAHLVSILSLGYLKTGAASDVLQHWVSDAVALVPLVVMLMLRTVIRRPLYKTLVHALREVNPQAAMTLEAAPRLRNPTKKNTAERVLRTANNVGTLLLTDLVIYAWHQLPIVGRAAGPVMHFLNMVEGLGLRRAAVISLLGLWGPLQWWIFQFVRLWRASRVLGEELLEEWVARTVPHTERKAWFRANDAAITLFVAPQALLMQAPFVGPLIYVPMQFAIAWLLDFLLRQQQQQQTATGQLGAAQPDQAAHSEYHPSAFQAAPTKPEPLQGMRYPVVDNQQTGAAAAAGKAVISNPEQASAPPWGPSIGSRSGGQYPAVYQTAASSGQSDLHQRPGAQVEGAPGLPVV